VLTLSLAKGEKKTSIDLAKIRHRHGEDLKEYIRRFNHEAVLIPDLQDGEAYMAFLNELLPGIFKFSLAESKVTTIADALRNARFYPSHGDRGRALTSRE